jgi:hypothetical protein
MTPLAGDLDLDTALTRASEIGAAFIAHALTGPALAAINVEIRAGSFKPLPDQLGAYGVREEAELLQIAPDDTSRFPTTTRLGADIAQLVHQQGKKIAGLDGWEPNDIAAMRYHAGSLGITPHRDGKGYKLLIAIFTVEGSAPFTLCANRKGDIVDQWQTASGSLILMRGPGLRGIENDRPFNTVAGPRTGTRVSLTFRMSPHS